MILKEIFSKAKLIEIKTVNTFMKLGKSFQSKTEKNKYELAYPIFLSTQLAYKFN